jgi:very-short-patch-repair endonuclease
MPPSEQAQQNAKQLRGNLTSAERTLWSGLRNRQLNGLKFRRQQPISSCVVDLYCSEYKLVIELDGHSHADQVDYDQRRTKWLERQGYRVLRFINWDVTRNLTGVQVCLKGLLP